MLIDKYDLLKRINDLIMEKSDKMRSASKVPIETKVNAEGYIEALYHVENLVLNWVSE